MEQAHGDRLSTLDAAFLHLEEPAQQMHVGGLFVFDGNGRLDFQRFVDLIRSRLHLVPRYRHRLAYPSLGLATPTWVDDERFDIAYHVRHAALPVPGTMSQLTEYAARILARPLDRDRPLWELYVIEGMEDGRFAVLGKNHHAMVDGVAGMDLATVLFDLSPDDPDELPEPEPWTAQPAPSASSLTWSAVSRIAEGPASAAEAVSEVIRAPRRHVRRALRIGHGVVSVARRGLGHRAPTSLLNQQPGTARRFAVQRLSLQQIKTIKDTFGTTVNDVVLAIVSDATGRYLRGNGAGTDGLWLKIMVPVSVRSDDDAHALGNRVSSVFVDLPMFELDPVERLRICGDAMGDVKRGQDAVGADFLVGLSQFAPPTLHAAAARLGARGRLFNFVVTNVPGPQVPVYCLGARLEAAFPFVPLARTQAYSVGAISLDGWLNVGFVGDYQTQPELEAVTGHLRSALDDLLASAEAASTHHDLVTGELQIQPPPTLAATDAEAADG